MQNSILQCGQNSTICQKPGYLQEKLRTLTTFNYHRVQYFLLKFYTLFLRNNVYKRVLGIFLFCLSWVINKDIKILRFCECVETSPFLIFANNSWSKQNKKNLEHPFVDIGKYKMYAKFQNKVVVGARQIFQFFRQNAYFLESSKVLSKFLYWILNHFIIITIKL